MQSLHEEMSLAEFEALPRELGWHYVYQHGIAHVTPCEDAVDVILTFDTATAPQKQPLMLRPLDPNGDRQGLLDLYFLAFHDGFECCDWFLEEILQQAISDIDAFLAEAHTTTRVAIESETGALVGAMLIVVAYDAAELRHLMVEPDWQRQGVAAALLHEVTRNLLAEGYRSLRSRYALGNAPSREWHAQMGFRE